MFSSWSRSFPICLNLFDFSFHFNYIAKQMAAHTKQERILVIPNRNNNIMQFITIRRYSTRIMLKIELRTRSLHRAQAQQKRLLMGFFFCGLLFQMSNIVLFAQCSFDVASHSVARQYVGIGWIILGAWNSYQRKHYNITIANPVRLAVIYIDSVADYIHSHLWNFR